MSLDSAIQDFETKSLKTKFNSYAMNFLLGAGSCEYAPGSFKSASPLGEQHVSYDSSYNVTSLIEEPIFGQRMDLTSHASQPVILETVLSVDPRPLYRRLKNSINRVSNTLYVYEGTSAAATGPNMKFRAEFYLSANGSLEKLVSGMMMKAGNGVVKKDIWMNKLEVVF